MFGAVNFLPQYMQNVRGASATASGLLLLPMMFGMLAVMLATGQITTRTGRYREFPIIGGAVLTVGMLLLLLLNVHTSTFEASALTAVIGLGMGFLMQTTTLITQNSAELRDMGAATGSVTLFRTVGGSLGIALLGSIYTTQLTNTLTSRLGAAGQQADQRWRRHPAVGRAAPAGADPGRVPVRCGQWPARHADRRRGHGGCSAFVVAWFIKAVPLRGSAPTAPVVEPGWNGTAGGLSRRDRA